MTCVVRDFNSREGIVDKKGQYDIRGWLEGAEVSKGYESAIC